MTWTNQASDLASWNQVPKVNNVTCISLICVELDVTRRVECVDVRRAVSGRGRREQAAVRPGGPEAASAGGRGVRSVIPSSVSAYGASLADAIIIFHLNT